MASPLYLSNDFATDVRAAASLPNSTAPGTTDADIYQAGDQCIRSRMVPLLHQVSEEYYTRVYNLAVTAGTANYRLPSRAVGAATRTVQWLTGPQAGNPQALLYPLVRIEPERLPAFQLTDQYRGLPWGFYLEGSNINLVPVPVANGTIRIRIQHRPGSLVDSATANSTSSAASGANYVVTTGTRNFTLGSTVDMIAGTPPFEVIASSAVVQASDATTVTLLQSDFSTPPGTGDWMTLPDTSPVVQVPVELEPVLVQYTAGWLLRSRGRLEQATALEAIAADIANQVATVLAPRTQGNVRKITGGIYSRRGPLGYKWGM